MLGGGMRQAGILAAAGIVALEDHVERLAEDHSSARRLAEGLASVGPLGIDLDLVQTNMGMVEMPDTDTSAALQRFLAGRGILVRTGKRVRLVTHLDVSSDDVDAVVESVGEFFS